MRRFLFSGAFGSLAGIVAHAKWPFPAHDPLAALIATHHPMLISGIAHSWTSMLFTGPSMLVYSIAGAMSLAGSRKQQKPKAGPLPLMMPSPAPSLVLGEVHNQRNFDPNEKPKWLEIPEKGLFTGVAVFGAIGSGKTAGVMYPAAKQLFSYAANDPARKLSGLVLEVKGDFCRKVKDILEAEGRGEDYVELAFDRHYRYNPLHSDLSASALAFKISTLVNNLYGAGKEPFWQQAYCDLCTWLITLYRLVDGYITMYDLFECSIDRKKLQKMIQAGEKKFQLDYIVIAKSDYAGCAELEDKGFIPDGAAMMTLADPVIEAILARNKIEFDYVSESGQKEDTEEGRLFKECSKWFYGHWQQLDTKLETSIVAGLEVLVAPFALNAELQWTLCPPKEYSEGKPFPQFSDLIESGQVAALNFPIATDPAISRMVATLMKMDFQNAMLRRIPSVTAESRAAVFTCDEYHELATAGVRDPSGDDHFFALSRQSKCIPIVATQGIASLQSALPHDSWRVVLQCFRTKVFLAMADDASCKNAADLCGHDMQLRPSYSISESGQDARLDMVTGKTGSKKASVGVSKSISLMRDFIFEPYLFSQLKNMQAVVLAYDGSNPHPPTICYLKPYWLPSTMTWFEQREKGLI